ncbi:MAG: hypothetical protein RLZZ500_2353 [Bacteroidota bacterium]|jgi:DNA processing protein
MRHSELIATLALLQVEGVGDILAKKLIHQFGSASEVFQLKPRHLAAVDGLGPLTLKNFKDTTLFAKAEAECQFIADHQIQVFYFQDANYPERLKHCYDGPILLYGSGTMDWNNRHMISLVGTREITPYGSDVTRRILEDLAPLNPVIVSGFAYGVDILAHKIAMELGLQTIGVLAHGLNQIYPKMHKKYVGKMLENGGFLTEFRSDSNPDKENFVRRNRIVAGMTEATVVIESAEKGGSLITANMANEYNREVFAVPGRITDKYSQGCTALIKTQRAHLLTSAADILYHLNWSTTATEGSPKGVQKQLFVQLEEEEQQLYDFLFQNGKALLDHISLECQMPVFKVSTLLLNMELKGVVRPLPGKLFEAI